MTTVAQDYGVVIEPDLAFDALHTLQSLPVNKPYSRGELTLKASKKREHSKAGNTPKQPESGPRANDHEPASNVLFEATIHAKSKNVSVDLINRLDIDRVPDPKGQIRALLTADDCVRVLDMGFEVRLHQAHPVRPLDLSLIETDESVRRWLKEKLRGLIPENKTLEI